MPSSANPAMKIQAGPTVAAESGTTRPPSVIELVAAKNGAPLWAIGSSVYQKNSQLTKPQASPTPTVSAAVVSRRNRSAKPLKIAPLMIPYAASSNKPTPIDDHW